MRSAREGDQSSSGKGVVLLMACAPPRACNPLGQQGEEDSLGQGPIRVMCVAARGPPHLSGNPASPERPVEGRASALAFRVAPKAADHLELALDRAHGAA